MNLREQFQIDASEQQRRKSFVGITEEDTRLLQSLLPTMEHWVPRIVEQFYDHLLAYGEVQRYFKDAAMLQRAKDAQREYLLDLFRGTYDEPYFERRLQIGVVHERIGLPCKWYIGSNSVFFQNMLPLVVQRYRFQPRKLADSLAALVKVMNLDQQLVMDTFIGSVVLRIQSLGDQVIAAVRILEPSAQVAADSAGAAVETATRAATVAEEGAETVQATLHEMAQLKANVQVSAEEIRQLSLRIDKLANIVKLLDGFVSDTNVLALNAAVQAARAGEQTKGFGVIADEIRKLADSSRESLGQAQLLVGEIQQATRATVTAAQEGIQTAEEGTCLARKLGDAFHSLAASAQETSDQIRQISRSLTTQSEAILHLASLMNRGEASRSGAALRPLGGPS